MFRKAERYPLALIWALVVLLGAVLAIPIGVEALGSLGLATTRHAVVSDYTYSQSRGYLDKVGKSPGIERFTLHLDSGDDVRVVLEDQPKLALRSGDSVDVGFVLDRIAVIDGRFVSTLGVPLVLAFTWFCSLLALATWLTALAFVSSEAESGRGSSEGWRGVGTASVLFVSVALSVVGAIPVLFVTLPLQALRVPGWPLVVIGLALVATGALCRHLRPNRA